MRTREEGGDSGEFEAGGGAKGARGGLVLNKPDDGSGVMRCLHRPSPYASKGQVTWALDQTTPQPAGSSIQPKRAVPSPPVIVGAPVAPMSPIPVHAAAAAAGVVWSPLEPLSWWNWNCGDGEDRELARDWVNRGLSAGHSASQITRRAAGHLRRYFSIPFGTRS